MWEISYTLILYVLIKVCLVPCVEYCTLTLEIGMDEFSTMSDLFGNRGNPNPQNIFVQICKNIPYKFYV